MLRILKGEDFVGIVLEDVVVSYCHSYFLKQDRIHDCVNPWHNEDVMRVVKKFAEWYPLYFSKINMVASDNFDGRQKREQILD